MTFVARVCLLLFVTLLAACADDTETWPPMRADLGLLTTSSEGRAATFLPDGREALRVGSGPAGLAPDSTYRVVATYRTENGAAVITGVSTVMVAVPHAYKEEKTDPLDVSSVWLGGGFLNLRLIVKTRLEGAQYFGFIDRGLVSWPDGRTTASVQLYHDQSGDPASFSRTAYLSMPLSAFDGVLTLGDTIRLRVNTFGEGEKTWTLVR